MLRKPAPFAKKVGFQSPNSSDSRRRLSSRPLSPLPVSIFLKGGVDSFGKLARLRHNHFVSFGEGGEVRPPFRCIRSTNFRHIPSGLFPSVLLLCSRKHSDLRSARSRYQMPILVFQSFTTSSPRAGKDPVQLPLESLFSTPRVPALSPSSNPGDVDLDAPHCKVCWNSSPRSLVGGKRAFFFFFFCPRTLPWASPSQLRASRLFLPNVVELFRVDARKKSRSTKIRVAGDVGSQIIKSINAENQRSRRRPLKG